MYTLSPCTKYARRCRNKSSRQFQVEVRTFCLLIRIRNLCTLYPLNASLREIQKERTVAEFIDPVRELKPV